MKSEEKASKKIHVLKKQVKKMMGNNEELSVRDMVLHNLHGSQQDWISICVSFDQPHGNAQKIKSELLILKWRLTFSQDAKNDKLYIF